jgi:large subunit ribosomal protein L29
MKENAERARGLDATELQKQLRDSSEQLFRLRFQMSMGQMEGLKKYRSLKKERARMQTILRERDLEAAKGESGGTASAVAAPAKKSAPKKPVAKTVKTAAKAPAAKVAKPAAKKAPAAKPAAKKASSHKTSAGKAKKSAK